MRVVFDTVVLVRSVINPLGWCGQVVVERRGRYEPVVSPAIVTEYITVLHRPVIVRKYGSPSSDALRPVLELIGSATVVVPSIVPSICRDPGDDKFLAAAKARDAEFIVTEDRDLLDIGTYEGSRIVTAEAFLRMLGTQDDTEQ